MIQIEGVIIMTEDSSGKGIGLFGKKGMSPKDVKLCIINRFDREPFFQRLREYGWDEVETAFTFDFNWSEKKIRKAATEHAADVAGDLLIEVKDRDYSRNPYNDYVYYVWRSGPNTRGLPPPPSATSQQYMAQQMIQQQQVALMQQQQMLQRMQMQIQTPQPQQPAGVPTGQICARCGNNQIQFMANGMGKCIKCGFTFQWQQQSQVQQPPAPQQQQPQQPPQQPPPQQRPTPQQQQPQRPAQQRPQQQPQQRPQQPQQRPPQQQPQQRPPQQPQQRPQQQPQQRPPQQMPTVPPPVQPGAPMPPGAKPCPQCGNVLSVFPDGSSLCNRCGYTGK